MVWWCAAWMSTEAFAEDPPPPAVVTVKPGYGLTVTSGDGRFAMNVRGRIQLRESLAAAAPDDAGDRDVTMGTSVYTTRMWLQGHTFHEDIHYVLQLAFAPRDYRDGSISPIYDAFLDLTFDPNASVKVGQFLVPFDRLRTVSENSLKLPDRPVPISEFSLDRDVGAVLYSDHVGSDDGVFAYRVGLFSGGGPNVTTLHQPGGMGLVRLELRPMGPFDDNIEGDLDRREDPALLLGFGAAYNVNSARARSTTSTTFVGGTADYLHLAGDLVFKWHGFSLEGEFISREAAEDTIESEDDLGTPVVEYTRSGWGVIAQPGMMLTKKVEIAGRYSHSEASDGTDPALVDTFAVGSEEVALGLSWYLNKHRLKVQGGGTAFFGPDRPFGDAAYAASALVDAMF
jgi:phosphate-selective porin OprO and OprP